MRFRTLHWVLEFIQPSGRSELHGVFTCIPDLVSIGLKHDLDPRYVGIRLSLVKLDSCRGPLRQWESSAFDSVAEDLLEFVRSKEMTIEECSILVERLREVTSVPPATVAG